MPRPLTTCEKLLMPLQAYHTILLPHAELTPSSKRALSGNLRELIQLHDELLRDLHNIIPVVRPSPVRVRTTGGHIRHGRWRSADGQTSAHSTPTAPQRIRPERRSLNISRSSEPGPLGPTYSPQVAADLARCFSGKVCGSFPAYLILC